MRLDRLEAVKTVLIDSKCRPEVMNGPKR